MTTTTAPRRVRNEIRFRVEHRGHDTACWIWTGIVSHRGYGRTYRDGVKRQAHCAVYEEMVGPIPAGHVLDHLCRERRCVNPEHVEPVTVAENTRRGRSTRLTADLVERIRTAAGTHSSIAAAFGVSRQTVGDVKAGRTWRDAGPVPTHHQTKAA